MFSELCVKDSKTQWGETHLQDLGGEENGLNPGSTFTL